MSVPLLQMLHTKSGQDNHDSSFIEEADVQMHRTTDDIRYCTSGELKKKSLWTMPPYKN